MSNTSKYVTDAVLGYVSKETDRQDLLPAGKHVVTIQSWHVTHSRETWKCEVKPTLPKFVDPTPQIGIAFSNEDGLAFYRANMLGFRRFEELTEAELASDKFERVAFGRTQYACKLVKGKLVRVKDKKRTDGAHSIVDQIMAAIGMTGEPIQAALDTAVAEGMKLTITCEDDEFDGKAQVNIVSFNQVKEVVSEFGS